MTLEKINLVIAGIEKDVTSGSATLVDKLIISLVEVANQFTAQDKRVIIEKINQLSVDKPYFATLQHFAATIKNSNDNWLDLLIAYKAKFDQIHLKISEQLLSIMGKGPKIFLLHSNSKTVTSVFETIPSAVVAKIYQTRSAPENEGTIQAKRLEQAGHSVVLVDDNPEWSILESIDLFVVGADLILPSCFINKAGTLSIAKKTNQLNKPCFVLADQRKMLSVKIDNLPPTFERIPLTFISNIITGENQAL